MFAFQQPGTGTGTANAGTSTSDIEIDSSTPFVAASDGDLPLLQRSLTHLNVPPSISDTNGLTPLHSAASYNQIHVIRWLLSSHEHPQTVHVDVNVNVNVNVNAKDNDGDTPLHHCDHAEAARVLIQEGNADATIRNAEGKTALEVKEEELKEMNADAAMDEGDDDDDDGNDEKASLEELVGYLKSI